MFIDESLGNFIIPLTVIFTLFNFETVFTLYIALSKEN